MYRKFYGLKRHPFEKDLKPDELFASIAAAELEARLDYLLQLRGIGLITGEVGSGKTSICRKVAKKLNTGLYKVFYVPLTTSNVTDTYKSIAWEMGITTERSLAALYKSIRTEVDRLCLELKIKPILQMVHLKFKKFKWIFLRQTAVTRVITTNPITSLHYPNSE